MPVSWRWVRVVDRANGVLVATEMSDGTISCKRGYESESMVTNRVFRWLRPPLTTMDFVLFSVLP